jgi:hypothetical protein
MNDTVKTQIDTLIANMNCKQTGVHKHDANNCKQAINSIQGSNYSQEALIYAIDQFFIKLTGLNNHVCKKELYPLINLLNVIPLDLLNKICKGIDLSKLTNIYKQQYFDHIMLTYPFSINLPDIIYEFLDNKVEINKEQFRKLVNRDNINVFEQFHYDIDQDDLYFLTGKYIRLSNPVQYNITFDQAYYEYCCAKNIFLYNVTGQNTLNLLKLCITEKCKITAIKKIIKSGIKPDITCLELACKHRNYNAVVKLIRKEGNLTPNITCYKNMVAACSTAAYNSLHD